MGDDAKIVPNSPDIELIRIPGLFRNWEIVTLLRDDAQFRIEPAGYTEDGQMLFALFRSCGDLSPLFEALA